MEKSASSRLRRYANVFARLKLLPWHSEYHRVSYSKPHAANYAYEALRQGYSESQIEGAYYHALVRYQTFATDLELRDIEPSGLVFDARRRLALHKPENPHFAKKPAHTM